MKVKFGALIVEGRGKINGWVASRNRGGSYFRTKVTPINPSTSYQVAIRSRLAAISSGWSGLTAAQRAAWNAVVGDFAKTDIFGDLKNPSGFNLYQRLNNNLITCSKAAITSPPVLTAVPTMSSLSLAVGVGAGTVILTYGPAIPADIAVKVFATAPMSAGKNFVKSEYRLIDVIVTADSSPFDITTEYEAKFGDGYAAGQKIFVKCVPVQFPTGISGLGLSCSTIVVA